MFCFTQMNYSSCFGMSHGVCCSLKIILELTFSFQKQLFLLVTSLVPVPVTTSVAITKLPVCAFWEIILGCGGRDSYIQCCDELPLAFCSLQSQRKLNSLPVTTVTILHLYVLMMVGKMLKDINLVMSIVGKIFFLHKLWKPLILYENSSFFCSRMLVWLISIQKTAINGAMMSILFEQSSVPACFLDYALLWWVMLHLSLEV